MVNNTTVNRTSTSMGEGNGHHHDEHPEQSGAPAAGKSDLKPKPVFPSQPAAVTIIEPVEEENSFRLNEEFLERILLDPEIADKKVSVISVAGAFRKGKSFLLNFFLRYLKHHHLTLLDGGEQNGSPGVDDRWLESEPKLQGFSWRGGSDRDTSGILLWSQPFIVRDRNGEEIVVLLMDTQGAFDSMSTVKNCATIFALSTMISSLEIYNLGQQIQEDDLQHLQLFTEYGRLALEDGGEASGSRPFQTLLFLIRDWSFPYEAEYGFIGGQRILDRILQINDRQHPELQQVRRYIRASFDDIQCFLMPHPGLNVARSPDFKGETKYMDDEFLCHLRTLIPRILDSNNIVVKQINGQPVTCRELVVYFKAYIEIFHGEDLPEPKSMIVAISEANNLAAVASSKAVYVNAMEEICGGDTPFISSQELLNEHQTCKHEAIRHFKAAKKMGGTELSLQFLQKLDDEITDSYESFVRVNNSKNLFKSMRTPAVLVAMMVVNYMFQEFFQLLGADLIASVFSFVMMLAILCLTTWTYARYSGTWRHIGQKIDEGVQWIWENFIRHLVASGVGHATNASLRLAELQSGSGATAGASANRINAHNKKRK